MAANMQMHAWGRFLRPIKAAVNLQMSFCGQLLYGTTIWEAAASRL